MKAELPIVETLKVQKDFFDLLNEHQLSGLFAHYFQELNPTCQSQYRKQWIYNQLLLEELKSFRQEAILLKGAHFLHDLYSDLGSRFLSDIDLLISKENITDWTKELERRQFLRVAEKTFMANSYKQLWSKNIDGFEITFELHTKLFFHQPKNDWQSVMLPGTPFKVLDDIDLIIYLCGHLAFQHTFLKLYWLFDLYFLIQKNLQRIDWKKLEKRANEKQLRRSVQMCLWCLKNYFNIPFEEATIAVFELDKNHWWARLLTMDFLLKPQKNILRYLLMKHATKDHLKTALYYDLAWFYRYKVKRPEPLHKA